MRENSPCRADIQGLRGIAVTIVVLAHVGLPGFSGGFVGVDVFRDNQHLTNRYVKSREQQVRKRFEALCASGCARGGE